MFLGFLPLIFGLLSSVTFCEDNNNSSSNESTAAAISECFNGGTLKNGICECTSGFVGSMCQRTMHCAGHTFKNDNTCVQCDEGYIGIKCDVISCKNGKRIFGETCKCDEPFSGQFCDQLVTSDVYLYYNRMITQFGPIGVLIVIPMIIIRYGCSHLAKKRQTKRVEQFLEEQTKTDVSATLVADLLHK